MMNLTQINDIGFLSGKTSNGSIYLNWSSSKRCNKMKLQRHNVTKLFPKNGKYAGVEVSIGDT